MRLNYLDTYLEDSPQYHNEKKIRFVAKDAVNAKRSRSWSSNELSDVSALPGHTKHIDWREPNRTNMFLSNCIVLKKTIRWWSKWTEEKFILYRVLSLLERSTTRIARWFRRALFLGFNRRENETKRGNRTEKFLVFFYRSCENEKRQKEKRYRRIERWNEGRRKGKDYHRHRPTARLEQVDGQIITKSIDVTEDQAARIHEAIFFFSSDLIHYLFLLQFRVKIMTWCWIDRCILGDFVRDV